MYKSKVISWSANPAVYDRDVDPNAVASSAEIMFVTVAEVHIRLTSSQIKHLFFSGKELLTEGMSRKEKQYYAKKVFMFKKKRNMKIVFDKKAKSYKYYPNGL